MCRFRQVCNVYNRCGHAENLVGPPISALSALNSPIANSPTNCKQYPEQFSPHIDAYCPKCAAKLGRSR
ncbi:hypothetical protein EV122DRAFT_275683 [Schizophyllum commune]